MSKNFRVGDVIWDGTEKIRIEEDYYVTISSPYYDSPIRTDDTLVQEVAKRYSEERLKEWKERLKQKIQDEYRDEFLYATDGILKIINSL
jgi:hypothetical protein